MKTVLIKQATVAAGRDVFPGDTLPVDDKTARDLVAVGFAVEVDPEPAPVEEHPLFVASNEDGTFEKSAKPTKRARK